MQRLKILVCDDVAARGRRVVEEIQRGTDGCVDVDLQVSFGKDLTLKLDKFYKTSVETNLKNGGVEESVFDDFDIIVIDNNLSELQMRGFRLTADVVIGHIRAFSNCKVIVLLNKHRNCDFDLRALSPNSGEKADVELNQEHLSLKWLWSRCDAEHEEFRPWYWPKLLEAPTRRENQISELMDLNQKVLEFFDFPKVAISELSRSAVAALHPEKKSLGITKVSFRDYFLKSCVSLIDLERKKIVASENVDAIRRIVCFELESWLQRFVLGPQTVLVDLPHLLLRLPVILGDEMKAIERWTETSRSGNPPFQINPDKYKLYLEKRLFAKRNWMSVPAFWGGELRQDEALNRELVAASIDDIPDAVFCEDLSRFERRLTNKPLKFVAEFHSNWDQRYVMKLRGKRYIPADRLVR